MEFVQFDCKTAKTGAILMYWLDDHELPYTIYCPNFDNCAFTRSRNIQNELCRVR